MSIQFCEACHEYVDKSDDPYHFDEGGNCVEFIGYQLTNQE